MSKRTTPLPFLSPGRQRGRVLIIQDGLPGARDYADMLEDQCTVHLAALASVHSFLSRAAVDAIVVSLDLQEVGALCHATTGQAPADVVAVTSLSDVPTATAAMQLGVADLVLASDGAVGLRQAMMRLLRRRLLAKELERLEEGEPADDRFPQLVGKSGAVQSLRDNLARVADSSATVLITGESGTGKELVARALHDASPRRHRAFVAIACSAIPPSLLEAELFGHRKGAFTGADQDRAGLFARADGGTLFLDQMSDMPLDLQAKLLRAIQERRVRPIGGRSEQPFDARVVAATRRDLASQVAQGTFREDLYFRLKVIELKLAPLRDIREDLLRLAYHFIRRASRPDRPVLGLTVAAARALLRYDWPGNVRELEHCMTAAVALARHDRLCATDLPEHVTRGALQGDAGLRVEPLKVIEERHVKQVLDSVDGNKARAARILGLDRKTLQRKVAAYAGRLAAASRRRADSSPG